MVKKYKFIILFLALTSFVIRFQIPTNANNIIEDEFASEIQEKEELKDTYLLGAGDILRIQFYGAPDFNGDYKILTDGSLSLPVVGNIYLKGKSLESAKSHIEKNFSNELINPSLLITLKESRPIKIFINGEIKNPGIYTLEKSDGISQSNYLVSSGPGFFGQASVPTILDAIQKAGGITNKANLSKVTLKRKVEEEGFFKKANLNLISLIKNGDFSQNPFLFDGDVITISKSNTIEDSEFKLISSTLAGQNISINVIGKVAYPGSKIVNSNTTLTQAILLAGGPVDWEGDKGNIRLIRFNKDGSFTTKKYHLSLNNISNKKNPILNEGDIISVYPTKFYSLTTGLDNIIRPFSSFVSAYSLYKILE